jgi:integral membrane sensor domain MASE1
MIPLFIGLTLVNLLGLCTAGALGYASRHGYAVGPWHILAGAMAALTSCGVHCVVFTYFIATAKWVQHAVSVKHLDPALATPTRSFRAQAFPAALLAMASVILTAFVGAAADNYHGRWHAWHHGLAIAALATNVLVALVEYRAIDRNARLIDGVLARIGGG